MSTIPAPAGPADVSTDTGTFATLVTDDPPVNDTWTVRLVALGLIVLAVAVVVGQIILSALERGSLPGEISTIGAGAAGALGGLLASTASKRNA